jgi:hypothetical protein
MRRLVFLIALLALAMPVSLATAKHVPVDHVFGDATLEFPASVPPVTEQTTFDVTGDPLSTAASGSFRKTIIGDGVDIEMTGLVDCLRVVGDTAYISGTLTASKGTFPPGSPFYQSMRDTSPDGTGDTVSATFLGRPDVAPTLTCEDTEPPEHVITSGNIVIEQCDWINGSGKCKTKD